MSPEEISFINIVEWHRENLIRILKGELATRIFTESHHKRLVKYGVLQRDPHINRTLPTVEARILLGV